MSYRNERVELLFTFHDVLIWYTQMRQGRGVESQEFTIALTAHKGQCERHVLTIDGHVRP
jgi:hypothetical protein